MPHWLIAVLKIVGMFAVMLLGWEARRSGKLSADTASALSCFLVDIALPAQILSQIAAIDEETLHRPFCAWPSGTGGDGFAGGPRAPNGSKAWLPHRGDRPRTATLEIAFPRGLLSLASLRPPGP